MRRCNCLPATRQNESWNAHRRAPTRFCFLTRSCCQMRADNWENRSPLRLREGERSREANGRRPKIKDQLQRTRQKRILWMDSKKLWRANAPRVGSRDGETTCLDGTAKNRDGIYPCRVFKSKFPPISIRHSNIYFGLFYALIKAALSLFIFLNDTHIFVPGFLNAAY